ncbi:MAG: class I SAM-dependent methyltransferase [Coriobacteriia bacterium]|nr:class I SAM-dependent methyltransferase [Coriobacteriia bacterium]MCL2870532.1 class I SAM-dependent methyltransferase [Coriobacteriia bacterium]
MISDGSYIATNKQAWEEAFDLRKEGYGDDVASRLQKEEPFSFFENDVQDVLKGMDFAGKTIGHLCCNNGRELLSLMQSGAARGVGFDIAENIVDQARKITAEANIENCEFVVGNVLDIPDGYHDTFDFIFFTIGALPWIENLDLLFQKVTKLLRPSGILLINEGHPVTNMLAVPGEPDYDQKALDRAVYPYFKYEPWIELIGLEYMTGDSKPLSQPLTSYAHTMGDIVTAIAQSGLRIQSLKEFSYDIGMVTEVYDSGPFPLSYVLLAAKV